MIVGNEKTMRFGQLFQSKCGRRYVRTHNTILNAILNEFRARGYDGISEWQDKDEDSTYRYDIIAQKGKELNVVEIKDIINIRDFGQIDAYCLQVRRENPNARVWLGCDCKNYDGLVQGEIGLMTLRLMKEQKLGIILINPNLVWFLKSHNDLLNLQERGHICENCSFCEGFTLNEGYRKALIWVEEGCKGKIPKITQQDISIDYTITKKKFQEIKTEFIGIRKQMDKKKFEEKTGIKLEG